MAPLKDDILNGISERDLFQQITIIPTVTHEFYLTKFLNQNYL